MLESIAFSSHFWKSWRRIGIQSSLGAWFNSLVKPSGSGLLTLGKFLTVVSVIPCCRWVYLDCPVLCGSVQGGYTFLGTDTFLLVIEFGVVESLIVSL